MTETTKESLKAIIKTIDKEFGDGTAFLVDDGINIKVDVIPTGIIPIDEAIGSGIPRGRITEIFGAEATGKTTLCFHTIASAQKMGLGCAFIDAEHAVSFERMRAMGVDTSKLVFSQPNSGEEALNLAEMMVRSGKLGLICIDSVAALVPQVEIEKDVGDSVMGVHAKMMSQAMRKLTSPVNKYNVALIFTNQTRTNIGGYGNPVVTTGGNALKFYASLRLEMKYKGKIEDNDGQRISGKYQMTAVKNKIAIPFKLALFEINERGIDGEGYFVDKLVESGVIEKSGAFFKHNGEVLAQGKRALVELLRESPKLKESLKQQSQTTTTM